MKKSELPQSKIGSEEPIFASPLLKAGAKIAPHRGARAVGPPFHIPHVNNNLPYDTLISLRMEAIAPFSSRDTWAWEMPK